MVRLDRMKTLNYKKKKNWAKKDKSKMNKQTNRLYTFASRVETYTYILMH